VTVFLEKVPKKHGGFIINRFIKGDEIGKGGFAKVFSVTHLEANKVFAAKVIPKSSISSIKAKKRALSEIKIHNELDHPNIVKLERVFEDQESMYMVMELCKNKSLSSLLKSRTRLTELEVRYYLRQIIEGLRYMRNCLVIHRDLKPGNIFLDEKMQVKIGDFGLAAILGEEHERRKTICGTPNYVAPEMLKSENGHSFEVDVWALGVIFYTMLVGRPPFEGEDMK